MDARQACNLLKRTLVLSVCLQPAIGLAEQVRSTDSFDLTTLPRGDDNSSSAVSLGFTVNFFGNERVSTFVNNNGNITFDSQLSTFTPFSLSSAQHEIVAPFFADVDTTNSSSGVVTYGTGSIAGRNAFVATWDRVGYFPSSADKLNRFQVVLVDRSDISPGDFDIEFNYDQIQWESGSASGGTDGLGGSTARAGFANGSGEEGTFFEITGSGESGAFLDSNELTALIRQSNINEPGRFIFQVRNGVVSVTTAEEIAVEAQQDTINDTAPAALRGVVNAVLTTVQNRVRALRRSSGGFSVQQAALEDGESAVLPIAGLSSGDAGPAIGLWTEGSLTRLSNTTPSNKFSGNGKTLLIGADYPVMDELILGVAMGVESLYIDLSDQQSERRAVAGSGTVYTGYLFTDWLLASAQFTFTRGRHRIEQRSALSGKTNGKFDATRLLGSISVSAFGSIDNFDYTVGAGYNRAREWYDSYNDSLGSRVDLPGTSLGQVTFSSEFGYNFVDNGQVFVLGRYEWDHRTETGVDPNGLVFGGGVRYGATESLELSILGTAQTFRQDDEQYTLTAGLRYTF